MQPMRLLVTDAAAQPPRQSTAWLIMTLGRNNPYGNTARDIRKDMARNLRVHVTQTFATPKAGNLDVISSISYDFEAGVKYASVFIPSESEALGVLGCYLNDPQLLRQSDTGIRTESGFRDTDEKISSDDLLFSPQVLVYTSQVFPTQIKQNLIQEAKVRGLVFILRDGAYIQARLAAEKPMAFISHDSRDKEAIARSLAVDLQKALCTVWYDEFSLIPGQSLRASIERGLKECRKCVLILSPHFLSNGGWTKAEFDSIFTREILEQSNIIIPVWHNITKEQVYEYSPRLLDKVGIPSSLPSDELIRRLLTAINHEERK